ncbi:unnamed protein product [Ectocarpus sp. CCAP 1310/34]|nr:unnamed protein product [Ectocarpus sp. CCAP 1310/34]
MSLKRTIRDDEHSVVAVEVEGGDACMATWQRRRTEGTSCNREVPGGGGQQWLNPETPVGYGR